MHLNEEHSTWIEINLTSIANNVQRVQQQTGVEVMAIVKANAYGHGAVPVAQAALQGGATWLGVARIEEALELRQADLKCPILLLGYTPPNTYKDAIQNNISLTVWTTDQIILANSVSHQTGIPAMLHLKIETGMNRIGVPWNEMDYVLKQLSANPRVMLQAVFTHYARADEIDENSTDLQEQRFLKAVERIQSQAQEPLLVHAANSATSLTRPSSFFNLVRLGIAMYGLHPSNDCHLTQGFEPALSWKTVLSHVKIVPSGSGISYGHEYITKREEVIGTLALGYADGFRRTRGNYVLIRDEKVPVIGRVCMDQCMVRLNSKKHYAIGEEVIVIGAQEHHRITAEDIAKTWGTINYEVTCGIHQRVSRIYINPVRTH